MLHGPGVASGNFVPLCLVTAARLPALELPAPDARIVGVVPGEQHLAVAGLGPEPRGLGRHRLPRRRGGFVGLRTGAARVQRPDPECVGRVVGKAGHRMADRGGAAAGDVFPGAVGRCRPEAVLPSGDAVVAGVGPEQLRLRIARLRAKAGRLFRNRPRRGGDGVGFRTVAAGVDSADFEGVPDAVGKAGNGVAGGGRVTALNVRPGAVTAGGPERILPAGNRGIQRVVPGQSDPRIPRLYRESRRFGRTGQGRRGRLFGFNAGADIVHSPDLEPMCRPVGQVGHDMACCHGAAAGDVGPAPVAACRPVGILPLLDRSVRRVVP